jgi:hypothetical protein
MNWTYWTNRFAMSLILATLAAALAAGPGALALPVTARLASRVACPPGTEFTQDVEVSWVDMICIDGHGNMWQVGWRIFLVLCGFYFVLFGGVIILTSFAIDGATRRRRRARTLGSDGPR